MAPQGTKSLQIGEAYKGFGDTVRCVARNYELSLLERIPLLHVDLSGDEVTDIEIREFTPSVAGATKEEAAENALTAVVEDEYIEVQYDDVYSVEVFNINRRDGDYWWEDDDGQPVYTLTVALVFEKITGDVVACAYYYEMDDTWGVEEAYPNPDDGSIEIFFDVKK